MSAGAELTPSEYIGHHLTFLAKPVGEGSFWVVHVDTLVTSAILGVLVLWFFWWIVRGATSGVPNKRQAFVELAFDFINEQVKGIFTHGDPNKFIAPTALIVFVWVLLMNAMDWLPVDFITKGVGALQVPEWRPVPTADVNTTFALALSVWVMSIYFAIRVKGFGGWVHELFCAPFGSNPVLWLPNLAFNIVEYVSKPLSHSLRLFGNMFAGEIIFLLLWMWAANGLVGTAAGVTLGLGWAIFHIIIVVVQAYIFMMLTVAYISMAHEHH
jgi:F-type H+-transporting ATPase subunit a